MVGAATARIVVEAGHHIPITSITLAIEETSQTETTHLATVLQSVLFVSNSLLPFNPIWHKQRVQKLKTLKHPRQVTPWTLMWRAFWEVETPQRKALCLGCWFQSMRDELEHITKYGMRILTDWQIHVENSTNWMPQITWNTCEDFTKLSTYLPRLLNFCCVHQLVVMDMVVQDALASACTHRR